MQILINLWNFLVIQHFEGLATILTIGGAIYLYLRNKWENKQQIATLLLNDIRNADSALKQIRDSLSRTPKIIPDIVVLPENNWKKFSNLFSRDFDEDETRDLNEYFSIVERINYIVTQHSNLFLQLVFTRMNALQNANINLLTYALDDLTAKKSIDVLDSRFENPGISKSPYEPTGFYSSLEKYLPEVPNILTSNIGKKLKSIANPQAVTLNVLFFLKKKSS